MMKRVICFDLWETLVTSGRRKSPEDVFAPMGYEDILAKYWPRELIQETVRELLMTNAWVRHPLADHHGQGTLSLTHMRMAAMLLTRLMKVEKPMRKAIPQDESDGFDWELFDSDSINFAELLIKIELYWRWENESVGWIEGAKEVLNTLKVRGETLALITNITSCGDSEIDQQLSIDRPHKRFFSVTFNSCVHTFAKPDRRVWEWLMEQQSEADEYWMIGNDPVSDIVVPTEMGWKTILVNHPDGVSITEVPRIILG